jgi:hypothetical protein
MASIRFDAAGPSGKPVPNSFTTAAEPGKHLAVCLPGRGSRATMPVLYYPMRLLAERGADILTVDYTYDLEPEFQRLSDAEADARIEWDVRAVLNPALSQHRYPEITLVGKSLGTVAMTLILPDDARLATARAVWLTPLVHNDAFFARMLRCRQRGIAVIGTADLYYEACRTRHDRLGEQGLRVVELPGADHMLETKGDVHGTVSLQAKVLQELGRFLDEA